MAALVLVALALFFFTRPPGDDLPALRADLGEVISRLDVLAVEYPKQQAGTASGAPAALRGARSAWDRAQPALARRDPGFATQFATNLGQLEAAVAANLTPTTISTQTNDLIGQLRAWLQEH